MLDFIKGRTLTGTLLALAVVVSSGTSARADHRDHIVRTVVPQLAIEVDAQLAAASQDIVNYYGATPRSRPMFENLQAMRALVNGIGERASQGSRRSRLADQIETLERLQTRLETQHRNLTMIILYPGWKNPRGYAYRPGDNAHLTPNPNPVFDPQGLAVLKQHLDAARIGVGRLCAAARGNRVRVPIAPGHLAHGGLNPGHLEPIGYRAPTPAVRSPLTGGNGFGFPPQTNVVGRPAFNGSIGSGGGYPGNFAPAGPGFQSGGLDRGIDVRPTYPTDHLHGGAFDRNNFDRPGCEHNNRGFGRNALPFDGPGLNGPTLNGPVLNGPGLNPPVIDRHDHNHRRRGTSIHLNF